MVATKGRVLITGVNGYIGSRTAAAFLDAGYSVRGIVRSRKSADALVAALARYYDNGRLEIVEVLDITVAGAFDAVLDGITAIAHLATPVSVTNTDVTTVHHAAIRGTLSVLESALRHPGIRSFILMSSTAAIVTPSKAADCSVADWNDEAVEIVDEKGDEADGFLVYMASKVKAERAFWQLVREKRPDFAVTALNPVYDFAIDLLISPLILH